MSFSDLPSLHDLLSQHACELPKDGTSCTCKTPRAGKSRVSADRRLTRWEEWMQSRKQVHQKLGKHLQRAPGELVMNSFEEIRPLNEEKLEIQYSRIPDPDAQRGNPGFWKFPTGLRDPNGEHETYLSVLTKEEQCQVPEIMYVGQPKLICQEKDTLPRTRNVYTSWKKGDYTQKKKLEMSYKLEKICPHRPETDSLAITGAPFTMSKPKSQSPCVQVNKQDDVAIKSEKKTDAKLSGPVLTINHTKFGPRVCSCETQKIYVNFEYDVTTKTTATQYIEFRNDGTTTIRFYWKPCEKVNLFKDIVPQTACECCFFFDKNEGLIIPSHEIKFPIWFKTSKTGIFSEEWQFYTKPSITPAGAKIIVSLHAVSENGKLKAEMKAIEQEIEINIRNRLIKECLSEVLDNIPCQKFKPTVYCYSKQDVFEAVNSDFNCLNPQPKYLYNRDVVRQLQNFYKDVRRPTDPKVWNYRLDDLRILAKAKLRTEEEHRRVMRHLAGKKIYENRPQFPTLPVVQDTFVEHDEQPVKKTLKSEDTLLTAGTIDTFEVWPDCLERIISKLDRGAMEKNLAQEKYSQAYLLLCTCFNVVEDHIEDLRARLGIVKYTQYPRKLHAALYRTPDRLVQETFYDVIQGPSLIAPAGTREDKPKAEILLDIPVEDTKRRFCTYFNLEDKPPAGKQAAKPPPPPKGKGKDDKAEKVATPEEDDGYVVNEQFDPYAPVFFPETHKEAAEQSESHRVYSNVQELPVPVLRHYDYNVYIIMYTNLVKAIYDIVDMIEMQPKENLPPMVIKQLEEPKHQKRLIDLKNLIAQERSARIKGKLVRDKYRNLTNKDWRATEIQRRLQTFKSTSSLWSLLKPYESQMSLPESKPESYPVEHDEVEAPKSDQEKAATKSVNLEPFESTGVYPDWVDFQEVEVQKDYAEGDLPDDLEARIEQIAAKTSVQQLLWQMRADKATQKKTEEHVSDEEYFYDSSSDADLSELSIDSQRGEQLFETSSTFTADD